MGNLCFLLFLFYYLRFGERLIAEMPPLSKRHVMCFTSLSYGFPLDGSRFLFFFSCVVLYLFFFFETCSS